MLLEISEYDILIITLRKIAFNIDEDLYINLINNNDIPILKFTKHNKCIYVTYNSMKFYRCVDIIYHAIYMIRRKGNEKYFDKLKHTAFILGNSNFDSLIKIPGAMNEV